MSDSPKKRAGQTARRPSSVRNAVSAVKLSERLTAAIDAWAEAHGLIRSDAISRLVEIGLSADPIEKTVFVAPADPIDLENHAIRQIGRLLDPSLPSDERERRIRRLIQGPPEFSADRIDLPKPRK